MNKGYNYTCCPPMDCPAPERAQPYHSDHINGQENRVYKVKLQFPPQVFLRLNSALFSHKLLSLLGHLRPFPTASIPGWAFSRITFLGQVFWGPGFLKFSQQGRFGQKYWGQNILIQSSFPPKYSVLGFSWLKHLWLFRPGLFPQKHAPPCHPGIAYIYRMTTVFR